MEWYYAVGGDRKGPVSDDDLKHLVQQGIVTSQTLVWREGMANWQPYAGNTPPPPAGQPPLGDAVTCAGCGGSFARTDVIPLANGLYCAACKPLALQRLKEGVLTTNSAAEEIRNEHLKHEASVKSVGVLYFIGGVVLVLLGLGNSVASVPKAAVMGIAFGLLLAALGVGQFLVGMGLRRLKPWARTPCAVLSGIGLLGFPFGTIINAYILYLVLCQKGKMVFSDEYRAVIEQTPHIKYRTSILVWILLGLVVLLIVFGIIAIFIGRS